MSAKTLNDHIVATPGTCSGRPRIAGTRIRVQHVADWTERLGMTPDQIASEYNLSLGDIHAALASYYDHIDEIRKQVQEDKAWIEEFILNNPDVHVLKVEENGD